MGQMKEFTQSNWCLSKGNFFYNQLNMMTAFNSFKETHLDIMLIKRDGALRYANKLNYHSAASPASSGREPLESSERSSLSNLQGGWVPSRGG